MTRRRTTGSASGCPERSRATRSTGCSSATTPAPRWPPCGATRAVPSNARTVPSTSSPPSIAERVLEDAIGLGGVQRYIVTAYGLDKVIGRLTLRENADASGAGRQPGDPIDSEPATERGLLTQTMRHLEISERTHATVVANIFAMQSRMLREKDERISHLEERHWETVIAAEQLVSDHHRRQLENRAADQKAEAMREVLGTFLQLAPTAVNKLAGRAVLPEKTSPALVGLRALVGTLKAEQLEAFKFVLTPAQLETFTEIVGSEVADEEKKTVKR